VESCRLLCPSPLDITAMALSLVMIVSSCALITMALAHDHSCSSQGCHTSKKGSVLLQQATIKQHSVDSINLNKVVATASSKPNILIIQPDDMYANFLGVSYAAELTPGESLPVAGSSLTSNMLKVATEGATFTHAYTASGMCSPSRAALLTGRYPSRNVYAEASTVSSKGSGVDTYVSVPTTFLIGTDSSQNIMTALKASGYTTGMTGKWHLSPTSESGGDFGESYADQVANVKSRGFDYVDGLYITNLANCGDDCSFTHNMEWIVDKGMNFMSDAIAGGMPFFLYFNPTCPHTPDVKEALEASEYGTPAGDLSSLPDLTAYCSDCGLPSRSNVWKASAGYGGSSDRSKVSGTYWIDLAVGAFYNFLSAQGVLDNTYIVIFSDNGNAKGSVYEMGARTAMMAKGPTITPGNSIDALVSNLDLAPTILEWAGSSSSALDMDGVSLAVLASGSSSSLDRDAIFLEMAYDRAVVTGSMKLYMAGQGKYVNKLFSSAKASHYPAWGEEMQLYDLTNDGAEQTNLASSDSYASTLASLKALLEAHKAATLNAPAGDTATTTTTTIIGECASWCATNAKEWSKKCTWDKCGGCSDCSAA